MRLLSRSLLAAGCAAALEPGALVPGLEAIQAVSRGSMDAAWSSPGFFSGTDSAFNMFSTVPFGPAIPEYLAWMYYGGGLELQNEMFAKYDIHPSSAASTRLRHPAGSARRSTRYRICAG
jgi:TRAP-type mannitol/chloroaromatic compound transport system substrate-binding protein